MIVTKLDVVNACFALQGEAPTNSLEDYNPAIAAVLDTLQRENIAEQSRGWWFNKELVTLNPNEDTFYYAPTDTLGLVVGDDGVFSNDPWMSMRGRRLYDNRSGVYYSGDKPIQIYMVRLVAFEELPYHVARLVSCKTVLSYGSNFDADQLKMQSAQQSYNDARLECNAEHIRAVRANLLTHGGVGYRRGNSRIPSTRIRSS